MRLLRRRRKESRGAPFLGSRPVPTRLAGYTPVPREPGRAPEGSDVPPSVTPEPVFPPPVTNWSPPYIPPFDNPGFIPPGGVVPPGPPPPPCDPTKDPECPPPPPPPHDVPEPATWLILLLGVLGVWTVFMRKPAPAPQRDTQGD
ncbi:MAG TPA: hypothetical protein DEA50_02430 [Parvularcula sp.]|nr:hypothetical protein [Parvularcula sp.]